MDDIQRKLALIDKQLSRGFINSYRQIISTCPGVFAAAGLIIGIVLQNELNLSLWPWLILLILSAIAAILLFATREKTRLYSYAPVLLSSCALISFMCLGAVRLTSFYGPRPNDVRNLVGSERKLAAIRGLLVTQPYINKNKNWKFANLKFRCTDPATSFYLKLTEVKTIAGWINVTGTIRVQVAEPILDLKTGDYIQTFCWLDTFKKPTNPGQFNIAKYLARKNIFITASVKSRDGIKLLKSRPKSIFTKIKAKLREVAKQASVGDLSLENRSRGLLEALLLGYRRNIDSATYQAFRRTGLLHFISLSGLHLGILIGIVWWLCKTAGLMKRARAVICIIAIAVFLLIVPPRAPTLRAAIIGFCFCLSFFFRRPPHSINTLSLAAIILLLIRPTQLFEPGWQLSFTAVLGILIFTEKVENFLHGRTSNWFRISRSEKVPFTTHLLKKFGVKVIALFSISFAAWLGSAGILLYHFYRINPLTGIWTVIAFPLVAGILTIGFLKMILSFLLPTLAWILGVIVTGLADSLIAIVKLFAHLHISQILIGHVPLTLIIFYYGFVLFTAFIHLRRLLIKKLICAAMILTIVFSLGAVKWKRAFPDDLVFTCLDVGHGQAILAQLPGGANVLFDAGSLYKTDMGRRIVTPFLDYSGINKIDALIISHNDIDHINGIPEIVEHCTVSTIYASDVFFDQAQKPGVAKFLQNQLKPGHKIQNLDNSLNLESPANIKILWPNEQMSLSDELTDNDKSLVCLLEFAGRKILLCSDIEKFAQTALLQLYPHLKADVAVVPHHGSAKTAEPDFLQNLHAEILICSCDKWQYERYLQAGSIDYRKKIDPAKLFYTATDGALAIRIREDGTLSTTSANK